MEAAAQLAGKGLETYFSCIHIEFHLIWLLGIFVEATKVAGSQFAVAEVPAGANGKSLSAALTEFETKAPGKAALLFGVDPTKNKYAVIASVPAGLSLNANEWIQAVVSVAGGKGGGKADKAQASGDDASKVTEAIAAAKKFASEKLQGKWMFDKILQHTQNK